MNESNPWEYANLYFVDTWTDKGDYGPSLAVIEDGAGVRFLPYESRIKTMNLLGAEGWIIDTFHYSLAAHLNLPSYISALVEGVEGVAKLGNNSAQVIRREVRGR